MEGSRGGLRWSHEAGDYETAVMDEDNNLSPQHNYKLDVQVCRSPPTHTRCLPRVVAWSHGTLARRPQSNEQHQDEVDWRQYRDSVLHSLPHSWRRRDDT